MEQKIYEYVKGQLNEEQFKAAVHVDTSSLILAWAGSGKTRTVTYKIAYLIFGKQVKPERILAVTFTNKAAKEMKERIEHISWDLQSKPQSPKSNVEGVDFDQLVAGTLDFGHSTLNFKWIGTFHGVFLKFLKEEVKNTELGYTQSFGVYDETESMTVIKEVLKFLKMDEDVEAKEAKGFISRLKSQGISVAKFTALVNWDYEETMQMVYKEYDKRLRENNMLDFDDLLMMPYEIFKNYPEILKKRQQKFQYIMVDEAQDTNRIQFELMKQLSGSGGNITFIGDDYQSIYRRRGAVMENFLNVKAVRPDMQMFKLETNYRSKPHIVNAGNAIIKKNLKQYEKNVKPHRQGTEKIFVYTHSDEMFEAINVVNTIKKLKDDQQKQRSDFAILYRTNAQSAPFEQILLQEAVPYKVYWGFKFFERKEIKDVISYIKVLLNPRDAVALKRIINVPKRKIGLDSIAKLEEVAQENGVSLGELIDKIESYPMKIGPSTLTAVKQFSTMIRYLRSAMVALSPADLIQQLIQTIKYKEYLITVDGEDEGREKFENVGQLINMAGKYTF